MAHGNLDEKFSPGRLLNRTFLIILLIFCACSAKEPPLSPAAASFKQEVKACLQRLTAPLPGPVARQDLPAINKALLEMAEPSIKLCRMCPFQIGVVDLHGDFLGRYPEKKEGALNLSSYGLFDQVLKNRKTSQQRFFLQDGSEIYIIAVPIFQEGQVIGMLGLSLDAAEALHRWGLTDKEFLALDFNN
ncbi:MAG: hypothetical protein ACLP2P_16810 [Desulfobaccales bacterium]